MAIGAGGAGNTPAGDGAGVIGGSGDLSSIIGGAGGGGGLFGGGAGGDRGGGGGGSSFAGGFDTPVYKVSSDGFVQVFWIACPCLHRDMLITLVDQTLPIHELRSGALLRDHRGQLVPLISNIELPQCTTFVTIPKGVLGATKKLMIRPDHLVLYHGREIPAQDLVHLDSSVRVTETSDAVEVYTLITPRATFVECQGLLVGTWSPQSWQARGNLGRRI
jgi:hypothetical protein